MKYFRIPAVPVVSDQLLFRLSQESNLQSVIEMVLSEYFTYNEYTEGSLRLAAREVLISYINRRRLSEKIEENNKNENRKNEEKALTVADELWSRIIEYSITGIEPVSVLIGSEGESADISVPYVIQLDNIRMQCEGFIDKISGGVSHKAFSLSKLWSFGKALIGDTNTFLNKILLHGMNNPENISAFAEIIGSKERVPILTEIYVLGKIKSHEEIGPEYTECSSNSFIESLRYIIFLYRHIQYVSENWKKSAVSTVIRQLMKLECKNEVEVRVIINIILLDILQESKGEQGRKLLLLTDTISILEGILTEYTNSSDILEYCMWLCTEAECIMGIPPYIREDLVARIVRICIIYGKPTLLVNELERSEHWFDYFLLIQEYYKSQNIPMEITLTEKALLEINIYRSIKNRKKQELLKSEDISSNGNIKKRACIKYIDKTVKPTDKIYSGERVVIHVSIPMDEISKINGNLVYSVYLEVDNRRVSISTGKVRMSFINKGSTDRVIPITRIIIEIEGGTIIIPVDYTIKVLPAAYITPVLLYSYTVSPFGMTKVYAKGITPTVKDLLIHSTGVGYKPARKEIFYGVDSIGRKIRIHTPHSYVNIPKPRISYRVRNNSDIKYSISGICDKLHIYNGMINKARSTIRVNNRRVVNSSEDDTPADSEHVPSPVEVGIYNLISHKKIKSKEYSPIELVIRYWLYRKNKIVYLLKPFTRDNSCTLLDALPVCPILSPILVLHCNNTINIRKVPLEPNITNPYNLLGEWSSLNTLLDTCLFERKADQINKLIRTLSHDNTQDSTVHTISKDRMRIWYTNTALVRATTVSDGIVIYIQNYSAYLTVLCIIGMKITQTFPLSSVIYRSNESIDSLSVIMNTV
ncbi:hypothetical protein NEIG_00204 [Nematocida sp. ERTm5]|nr:hypothetical protein NEIG_00204 [Nematocida sp. ERTm5]